jgi:hypothetical protein
VKPSNDKQDLVQEQDSSRSLKSEDARIMSANRGPFADKMQDDPFEYEIIGDPCNDPDGIKFKVIGFSSKGKGNKRLVRKFTKITKGPGQRTFAKGKYIWKKGRLKGQDSWIILRDKIGGADAICQLVSEAEGTGKEEKTDRPKMDLTDKVVPGMKTTNVGGRKDTPEEKPKAKPVPKSASVAKPGTLKYYIENNETGVDDSVKGYIKNFKEVENAKKEFRDALKDVLAKERDKEKYTIANVGYGLMRLSDEPILGGASRRLDDALKIIFIRQRVPRGVDTKIFDLRSRVYSKVKSWDKIAGIAQEKSDVLASELNMPFFGTVIAASKEEPAKNKKPKPGPKTKKTDKTDKVKVPTGDLMGKDVPLEGMKMKITSNRLFLDGKPYKAVVDASKKVPGAGKLDLNFTRVQFTSDGERVFLAGKAVGLKASIAKMAGFPTSGKGEILTKDLVRYAKQLKSKGEVTVTEFDPPLQIVPASMSEALYMSPDQLNMFVLNELKSIGFIEDQKEENMKIAKSRLRQIIKEEIAQTLQEQESDSENLDSLILRIIDASGSKVAALRDATAAIPGEAESLYFDEENDDILLFATRDDMTRWEQAKVAKDQSASQPQAPASQMSMSGDELLASVSVGQPQYRSGGPGRVLHPAEEAESAQEQRDDLVKQWERYKSIPGATISFYKMPDDYKPRERWDRARAGKLFADVDHPSLD